MMVANRFFLLLLVLSVSAVWWLQHLLNQTQNDAAGQQSNAPDFYAETFTLRHFNADGTLHYRASGQSLTHYPADKHTVIKQPNIYVYQTGQAPLFIRSQNAHISDDGEHIILTGAVDVRQSQAGGAGGNGGEYDKSTWSLETEKLFVDSRRNYLETDQRVTMQDHRHKIQGVGMQAWLGDKKYRLLSAVRGTHEL